MAAIVNHDFILSHPPVLPANYEFMPFSSALIVKNMYEPNINDKLLEPKIDT